MKRLHRFTLAATVLALVALSRTAPVGADTAEERHVYLRVGDRAPAFACTDDQGNKWRSKDHVGKRPVVVYFYLADFLKPCTTQAKVFRDEMASLRAAGLEVVGVSGDRVPNHQLFKKTYRLNYPLLSDETGEVGKQFGVAMSGGGILRIKDRNGEEIELHRGSTAARWTFVIGKNGRIVYKNTSASPTEGPQHILAALRKVRRGR